MFAAAGTLASAPAPSGWRGVLDWPRAPLASVCEWPAPSRRCRPMTAALGRGQLSYAKVRALTRIATPETEARLLAVARAGTAVHVERIVQGWRQVDRQAEARNAARQHAGRAVHVHSDSDGTVVLRGRLAPEVGALLVRALDAARETLYQRRRALGPPGAEPAEAAAARPQRPPAAPARRAQAAPRDTPDP